MTNAFVDHMKLQHSKLQHIASKAFEQSGEPELALKRLDDAFAFASMAWENRKKFTKLSEEEVAVLPVWFAAWKMLDDAKYLLPDSTTEREIIEVAEEATKGFEIEIESAIRAATYAAHTTHGGKDDDSLISLEIARLITLDEINRVMEDILYLNTDGSVLSPLVEILVAVETKINRILAA